MKIYLAGPMRGLPDWNFPAFDAAEARWRAAGYQPFSPAAVSRQLGYPMSSGEDRGHGLHVIQLDLACIYAAEAIALLPGWEKSRGAAVELALAQFLGLPVYDAETMLEIRPSVAPWGHLPAAHRGEVGDWGPVWRSSGERQAAREVTQQEV